MSEEEFLEAYKRYLRRNAPELLEKLDGMLFNADPRAYDLVERGYYMYLQFGFEKAFNYMTNRLEAIAKNMKEEAT
ncbi:MAG: hypothetical protein JHC26_09680 [Thermofilum sp.]|uniref:hypothetical protein n=1 Tax=Thermofilum sp. TaxID=1961369 RepID=UPI002589AEB2|nr:hypothetical protein [Thermofilum sp.]MCI4409351.1 hypothetical protein [Thermofilum sp.]